MPEKIVTTYAKKGTHEVVVTPEISGLTITFPETSLLWDGGEQVLEEHVCEIRSDPDVMTDVVVALVRDDKSGGLLVAVDEIKRDGFDKPFQYRGSNYTRLMKLLLVNLPAGADDIEALPYELFHMVEDTRNDEPAPAEKAPAEEAPAEETHAEETPVGDDAEVEAARQAKVAEEQAAAEAERVAKREADQRRLQAEMERVSND